MAAAGLPPMDEQLIIRNMQPHDEHFVGSSAHVGETAEWTASCRRPVSWMRGQAGTSELRALVYADEVMGLAPPTAEPPSKRPILTLFKQARAHGVGMVLATQNPVDLDYKLMSNAGTWMVGRLQTERDKARIIEAMQSASGEIGWVHTAAPVAIKKHGAPLWVVFFNDRAQEMYFHVGDQERAKERLSQRCGDAMGEENTMVWRIAGGTGALTQARSLVAS